jgi:hypothetical protein
MFYVIMCEIWRLAHLILADPWGFPNKPENTKEDLQHWKQLPINSFKMKFATTFGHRINPFSIIRVAGPMGN